MTERRPSSESELLELLHAINVKAPDSLHRQVESLVSGSRTARRRRGGAGARPLGLGSRLTAVGALGAVVVVAVAIAVSSTGGASSGLSQTQAVALTLRPATLRAPAEKPGNHAELAAAVEGVSFPYWGRDLGWRATGSRIDRVGGRVLTTVFYANRRGDRVGYVIVGGNGAPRSSGGVVSWRNGMPYRMTNENGVPVVLWLRSGHLCVLSGHGVSGATLLRLASSGENGSVAS